MTSSKSFFLRKIVPLFLNQLKQGTSPQKLALSAAVGFTMGLFPIMGSTSALCFMIGYCFKLNHPTLQITNHAVFPLQVPLILIFLRMGEWIYHSSPISLSPLELKVQFLANPVVFLHRFGLAGTHAISAWCLIAPLVIFALYKVILKLLYKFPMPQSWGNN